MNRQIHPLRSHHAQTKHQADLRSTISLSEAMICGGASGFLSEGLLHPIDVIKTRLQSVSVSLKPFHGPIEFKFLSKLPEEAERLI